MVPLPQRWRLGIGRDNPIPLEKAKAPRGVTNLGESLKYNTKYLSHALHSLTGINFRRLLNVYRVNHAKALLKNDKNKSIAYVAEESGFGALNTFNREFKNLVGLTPREYRDLST